MEKYVQSCLKGLEDFILTKQRGIFFVPFLDECFPLSWIDRSVPVFFDFEGALDSDLKITKNAVWGLLPGRQQEKAIPQMQILRLLGYLWELASNQAKAPCQIC
jgi:hypothetical protein